MKVRIKRGAQVGVDMGVCTYWPVSGVDPDTVFEATSPERGTYKLTAKGFGAEDDCGFGALCVGSGDLIEEEVPEGGSVKKARITTGAMVSVDMAVAKWPIGPADPNLVFDAAPFGKDRYKLTADGFGNKNAYGCGALYVNSEFLLEEEPDRVMIVCGECKEMCPIDTKMAYQWGLFHIPHGNVFLAREKNCQDLKEVSGFWGISCCCYALSQEEIKADLDYPNITVRKVVEAGVEMTVTVDWVDASFTVDLLDDKVDMPMLTIAMISDPQGQRKLWINDRRYH